MVKPMRAHKLGRSGHRDSRRRNCASRTLASAAKRSEREATRWFKESTVSICVQGAFEAQMAEGKNILRHKKDLKYIYYNTYIYIYIVYIDRYLYTL